LIKSAVKTAKDIDHGYSFYLFKKLKKLEKYETKN